MALTMRWVGEDELDRVAAVRWQAFGHAGRELERFKESIRLDSRAGPGDFLLAQRDGQDVGTATSLSMRMWVRGTPVSCQGVAYVGTIKSGRRGGTVGGAREPIRKLSPTPPSPAVPREGENAEASLDNSLEKVGAGTFDKLSVGTFDKLIAGSHSPGVASAVMREVLRMARDRGHVVSALMPFRVSFYEHFGYGVVERRAEWTIPMPVLPRGNPGGNCDGWHPIGPVDFDAQFAARQHNIQTGQCDIERPQPAWQRHRQVADESGMAFVHYDGSYLYLTLQPNDGKLVLIVNEWGIGPGNSLEGLLCFLGTLADNYTAVTITVPCDWPVNRLLRERQIPHRPVTHAAAGCQVMSRMQLRILDHRRFLEALQLPGDRRGAVQIAVHETEGDVSRFRLEYEGGRAQVKMAGDVFPSADFECRDHQWAAIATGDMPASTAVRFGLASENTPGAAATLEVLCAGPLPFTHEYF